MTSSYKYGAIALLLLCSCGEYKQHYYITEWDEPNGKHHRVETLVQPSEHWFDNGVTLYYQNGETMTVNYPHTTVGRTRMVKR